MGSWFKWSHTMGAVGVRGSHNGYTGFKGCLTKRMQWGKTSLKIRPIISDHGLVLLSNYPTNSDNTATKQIAPPSYFQTMVFENIYGQSCCVKTFWFLNVSKTWPAYFIKNLSCFGVSSKGFQNRKFINKWFLMIYLLELLNAS